MLYKEVIKWLRTQSLPVAESHLRLRLESHPDYPSLLAVQDTLEELGVNGYACQGTKEELKNEAKPFLAHFNMNGGHVLFFRDVATAEKNFKDFDTHWSGNVMFAEQAKTNTSKAENSQQIKKEKLKSAFSTTAILLSLTAFLWLPIANGAAPLIILTITSCIGLYFSWLIAQKEFGISNSVSDKICSMAKHSRCESVLFSKGAKLFNWLTWGDVGIVYFSASLLYFLINLPITIGITNQQINLYYLISLAGLVFPIYSLYYQWKVVKQWCMLCMGVLAVLGINAIMSLFYVSITFTSGTLLKPMAVFALLVVLCLAIWQLLKSLYQQSLTSLTNEIKATRLKRNPEIFNALLEKEKANPINLSKPDEAIRFGNPAAPYQIVIACNPYCGPCAKAHQAIEALYDSYPEQLSVTVRFALNNNDEKDSKVSAAREILKAAKHKPYEAIKDWYHLFDIEKFKQIHKTNGEVVDEAIEKHIAWNKKIEIKGTPTFFINGRILPGLYSWVDFAEILGNEIRK